MQCRSFTCHGVEYDMSIIIIMKLKRKKLFCTLQMEWLFLSLCVFTVVQPVPCPFLFPCYLPKPIPTPHALHSHFPFISASARPGDNLREMREPGLPPLASALRVRANCWPHKSAAGWDLDHISRSLFGGVKQTEIHGEEKRAGSDTQMGEREWRRGANYNRWTAFPPQINSFSYYSLTVIHRLCIYWVQPWLFLCRNIEETAFLLSALQPKVREMHL